MKALRSGAEYVSNDPYLAKFSLSPRDKFLVIACDGLWDELSYQDAVGTILPSRHPTPSIRHPSSIRHPGFFLCIY
jgi:serine/threonine protein phosphatase PrpC